MFKVDRTYPGPASLERGGNYNGEDVIEALHACFFGKCYICETKDLNEKHIEHFIPKARDRNKITDWDNLYLACSRCNSIKSDKHNDILDCCNETVWDRIKLLPGYTLWANKVTIEPVNNDTRTSNTVDLLEEVYNTKSTIQRKISAAKLRADITKTTDILLENIKEYFKLDMPKSRKDELLERMKVMISRDAPYSSFCRWIIMEDNQLGPLLAPFMD